MGLIGLNRLGLGAASAAAQYVVTHPQTSHNPINLDFLLDPLSKSEFLSFSPFGDISTLMVWQKNKVHFSQFFILFLPALTNWLVPAVLMSLAVAKANPTVADETIAMKVGARRIILLFILTIATAVSFHNFLHLPPAAGMMLGLGYLGMMSFFIKKQEGRADRYDSILGQRPHETQHPLSAVLRKHRNKIIDAINEIKQPAVILDRDHIVTHWNKAIERLTDVPAKEVIGTRRHWHPFYPHERLVLADLVLENYSHKTIGRLYDHHYQKLAGIPNAYEAALFSPNLSGGGKWLSAAAAPLHDQNGDVQGVIELLEDHTESTGGSMLAIGSAAGVALMGAARGTYPFGEHLKWTPVIGLGYVLSILSLLVIQSMM